MARWLGGSGLALVALAAWLLWTAAPAADGRVTPTVAYPYLTTGQAPVVPLPRVGAGPLVAAMPTPTRTLYSPSDCNPEPACDASGDVGSGYAAGFYGYGPLTVWNASTGAELANIAGLTTAAGDLCSRFDGSVDDQSLLYDRQASRWVMQWPQDGKCLAVSQTSDPRGAWWVYFGMTGTRCANDNGFHDYPTLGVWRDAYYAVRNYVPSSGTQSGALIAYERAQMLQGLPAHSLCVQLDTANAWTYPGMTTIVGSTLPATNAPGIVVTRPTSGTLNTLKLYTGTPNWSTGAFTLSSATSISVNTYTIQSPYNSDDFWARRIPYRNWGSYEQLLVAMPVVGTHSSNTAIAWYELRNTGSGWTLHQEGLYDLDSAGRGYPAIQADKQGNIALAMYNFGGPGATWIGRLAADTLGTMPLTEVTPISQGDTTDARSALTVADDDCTFWYFIGTLATAFKFAGCT